MEIYSNGKAKKKLINNKRNQVQNFVEEQTKQGVSLLITSFGSNFAKTKIIAKRNQEKNLTLFLKYWRGEYFTSHNKIFLTD